MIAVLLAAGLLSTTALAGDAEAGRSLFMANCMACHGADADGNGPAARALKPPPRNFSDPDFWKGKTDEDLAQTIRSGRPGTAMMAFAQLSDDDVANLIAFMRTKAP